MAQYSFFMLPKDAFSTLTGHQPLNNSHISITGHEWKYATGTFTYSLDDVQKIDVTDNDRDPTHLNDYIWSFGGSAVQDEFEVTLKDEDGTNSYRLVAISMNNKVVGYTFEGEWPPEGTTLRYANPGCPADNMQRLAAEDMLDPTAATPPICFAAGTMIDTAHGARAIETLVAGDLVMTKDHGARPIRWIGSTAFTAQALAARENLRPIRIAAGALGDNRPATDLTVSRQHRVLVRSRVAKRMFGSAEALVPAKDLLGMPGVAIVNDAEGVCYFHMLFDAHEVVFSNGLETESLHTGPEAIKSLSPAAVTEIFTLFPELREDAGRPMARVVAAGRSARQMVARHVKNDKPLVAVVQ